MNAHPRRRRTGSAAPLEPLWLAALLLLFALPQSAVAS